MPHNPATRRATWPLRVQLRVVTTRHPRGRWGDVKGTTTFAEAIDYILRAQGDGEFRIRKGSKTVFNVHVAPDSLPPCWHATKRLCAFHARGGAYDQCCTST